MKRIRSYGKRYACRPSEKRKENRENVKERLHKSGKKRGKPLFTALAAGLLSLGLLTSPVSAAAGRAPTALPISTAPTAIKSKQAARHRAIPLYFRGNLLRIDGRLIESVTYVPVRAFFEALYPTAAITFDGASRTAAVKANGLTVSISDGARVLYANGRCFYSDAPAVILDNGNLYAPVRSLAATLSVGVSWNAADYSVTFTGEPRPLADASAVYDQTDLEWLARIISAEARGESLLGQVAVGNVVLNRVRSTAFPSTVKGVVFDKQGGYVQFSPVADGSIWREPTSVAVTAAKICLEGYTVSSRVLYFYAPASVKHSWISKNRPYLFTIGGHRFYG